MYKKYLAIVVPMVIKSGKAMLLAGAVLLWFGGAADATLIKVTATGSITGIFNISDAPFSIGDPFSYEVIIDDDPLLDLNPLPNYTVHEYSPNFEDVVAGSATLTFGSYTISESNVETTSFSVQDGGGRDNIEMISDTVGATEIDGISPMSFSLHRQDLTELAISSAVISPELIVSTGFDSIDAVYLFVDGSGACLNRRCAYGDVVNITAEFVRSPVPEPATILLLGSGLIGLAGFRRKFKK